VTFRIKFCNRLLQRLCRGNIFV